MRKADAWITQPEYDAPLLVWTEPQARFVGNPRPLYALTPAEVEMLERVKAGTHVCVPKEPTEEMVQASKIVVSLKGATRAGRVTAWAANRWTAMLEAASKGAT